MRKPETLNAFHSGKGQMFLIGAVFMLVGLVLAYNLLGTHLLAEEKQFQETRIIDRSVRNIAGELIFTAGLSTLGDPIQGAGAYMPQFASSCRIDTNTEILFFYVFVNGTTQRVYVMSGNYAGDTLALTVNITGAAAGNSSTLGDGATTLSDFAGSAGAANVTITYVSGSQTVQERLPIVITTSNHVIALIDVSLKNGDFLARKKEIFKRTW